MPPTFRATPRSIFREHLGSGSDAHHPVRSLYIHVPFCSHKCHYCDFYSIVDTQDRQEAFTARLVSELAALAPAAQGRPLSTIFVGGGTPSLLRVPLWERLLAALHEHFDLTAMRDPAGPGEFTIECNPESVTPELLATFRKGGVTRISMGAQSFHAAHLKTLERRHDPANVSRALQLIRDAGIERSSFDLIFGVPGQTLDEWKADLDLALGLGTDHLSCYNLTYEPNTAMTARLSRGEFTRADEDVEVDMYALTLATLRAAGLERYEVSNYAKPGQECRHNLAYWRQEQWLAAGPSASAHVFGHRWKNTPRLDDYLRFDEDGFAPMVDLETPDAATALREQIMTGMRLSEGVDAGEILSRAIEVSGDKAARSLRARVAKFAADGWLIHESSRWRLTDAGFLFADTVAGDLMGCIECSPKGGAVAVHRA